jgi:hypothetical protein
MSKKQKKSRHAFFLLVCVRAAVASLERVPPHCALKQVGVQS